MKKTMLITILLLLSTVIIGCEDKPNDPLKPIEKTCEEDPSQEKCKDDNKDQYIGTFNRAYPSYYEPGKALVDDAYVIYMNFDGFARYYYDELVKNTVDSSMPTLKKILSEGTFFDDLHTTLPSITNPCQNMILSGSTSSITGNVYRYYNKVNNIVIQQQRENNSITIDKLALNNGISVASIAHYLCEPNLTYNDPTKIYITGDSTNQLVVNRGFSGDHFDRFEQLIKLVKGEPIKTNGNKVVVSELPHLIIFYADDLDAVGHNTGDYYSFKKSSTEEGRLNNVLALLKQMDKKLEEFLDACKEKGIYDKITFFLTTDHGMNPWGLTSSNSFLEDYGLSKLGNLKNCLKKMNSQYTMDMVAAGSSPKGSTNVVAVGANLNIQLTWRKGITDEELEKVKEELLKEYYVGHVMTRKELSAAGYMEDACDMVVSPKGRYHFSNQLTSTYLARGQHDSLEEKANHIYGIIWGKGIKKNNVYSERAYNYDFGVTMAACLRITFPNANGCVLDIFERKE